MTVTARQGDKVKVVVAKVSGSDLILETMVNGRRTMVHHNSKWHGVKAGDTLLAEVMEPQESFEVVKLIRVLESDITFEHGKMFLSSAEVALLVKEALVARNYDVSQVSGLTGITASVDTNPTGMEVPRLIFESN